MINRDEYKSAGTYWIDWHVDRNNGSASYIGTYFDSLKENIIQKKFKKIIENKNVTTNIYRIEAYDSGPNKYEKKKDKMILKYFD